MDASFLRASLFTSVVSFGVAVFAIGVGIILALLGWATTALSRAVQVAAPQTNL
jgi:ABC-type Fe3+ transport system permease subunit